VSNAEKKPSDDERRMRPAGPIDLPASAGLGTFVAFSMMAMRTVHLLLFLFIRSVLNFFDCVGHVGRVCLRQTGGFLL
jgi:hypothetical protein